MNISLELEHLFSFPPVDEDDRRILGYTEFLEIKVHDDPGSPEIHYKVSIDPKSIRCCPEFIQFIDDYGDYKILSGKINELFKHSREGTTDLLFFVINGYYLLIDTDGYIHLGIIGQCLGKLELRFIERVLINYYGFRVYEKE